MTQNPLMFFPGCNHEICDSCIWKILNNQKINDGYADIKCPCCNKNKDFNVTDYEQQIIKIKKYDNQ